MSAAENLSIPPKFIACLIDISGYFKDTAPGRDLLERCGGKIFYSGFFDDSVNTHLCSFEKSVYIDVLSIEPERYPEDEDESDALNVELIDLLTIDDSSYWSRSDVERWKVEHPDRFKDLDSTFEEDSTFESRHDEVREELQGNPVF